MNSGLEPESNINWQTIMQQHTLHDLRSKNSVQYKVLHRVHPSEQQHTSTSLKFSKFSQFLALCTSSVFLSGGGGEAVQHPRPLYPTSPILRSSGDALQITQQLKPFILIAIIITKKTIQLNWKDRAYLLSKQ